MNQAKLSIMWLIALCLSTGCSQTTASPIATIRLVSLTFTLEPSKTSLPTLTVTLRPSATPTLIATSALTPTITPTPQLEYLTFEVITIQSPDQNWTAQIEISAPVASGQGDDYREHVFTRIRLINRRRNLEWVPLSEWQGYGVGYAPPQVAYWSHDGTYLLLSDHSRPDGCPGYGVSYNVRRVDLATGITALISASLSGVISVSPDEKTIVSVGYNQVIVHDVASARETVLAFHSSPGYTASGNVVWSPSGQAFVFITDFGYCGDVASVTVWKVELATGQARALLTEYLGQFSIHEWQSDNRILLSDPNGQRLWLDSETGQILDGQ